MKTNRKHRERWYQARFRVGEVLKGSLEKDVEVMIPVGIDCSDSVNDLHDLTPAWKCLMMCNTQAAYDIRINQVYLMCLTRDAEEGWDLRSGPYSLGWIQPENKLCFGALGQKWQDPVETDKYMKELKEKLAAERATELPR